MDAIQKRVVESLKNHPEFLDDKNILKGALMDIIPRDRLQANVLTFAYELEVIKRLKDENPELVKPSIITGLQANYGITKENAAWGVDTWCYILGIESKEHGLACTSYVVDSYEFRMKKALHEVQRRRYYQDHQISISKAGQVVDEPEKYENVLLQYCDINTIDLSKFKNLKHLYISYDCHGDLFRIPVPKELSIAICYDWKYLKQFAFGEAENLSLSIFTTEDVISFGLERTKKLSLSFVNRDDSKLKVNLDLTGCNNLEELALSHVVLNDIDNIGELPSLRTMSIRDSNFASLDWIQNWPQLEVVSFQDCNILELKGIEELRNLQTLNLYDNRIHDLSPAMEHPHLKLLNVHGNPVDNTQLEIFRSKGVRVVYTKSDIEDEHADWNETRFLESAIEMQLQEDSRPLSNFPVFLQKGIREARELPFEKRLEHTIQRKFSSEFDNMTPWRSWKDEDNWALREEYIKKKQELYPFIKVPVQMLNELELEKKGFCKSNCKNRLVFILDENIIAIDVEINSARGGVKIKGQESYFCSKIEDLVRKNWPSTRLSSLDKCFYEITITNKYWNLKEDNLIYPVILTALAACDGVSTCNVVVVGDFRTDGALKREVSSLRNIRLAEKEGANDVFIYGSVRSYDKKELSNYHLNYHYVKDYKDILEALKSLPNDSFEQMSLMDFM